MKSLLKQESKEVIGLAIFLIAAGCLLLFLGMETLQFVLGIVGWVLIVAGIIQLYIFFISRVSVSAIPLLLGIISLIFGYFFVREPRQVLNFITTIVGVILIINAVLHIQQSFVFKDFGFEKWPRLLVYPIIMLVIGIFLVSRPDQSLDQIMKICGILLIAEGIVTLWSQRKLHTFTKQTDDNIYDVDAVETESKDD
ncbi:HdeD family acid-resistance protein [Catenisphaera adipataccumulans]|jgi:uncharacterized membrane protein HdeD (DUF308 family)|uniref:Uncharacterized membrane protein HdeD (DUF308 family) n=1 Tax=Catenisphaera adipataccumulans TaxID=700500 RepID=A0A7W8CYZ6_9FIRM|nr:DUF308 domain-containing protein [Catenisphaera adipataccumulans]MBB5182973.1 uncharacterized membrane protein HdeD (DUF308 family) [Catenisphaera adipataccumulans]